MAVDTTTYRQQAWMTLTRQNPMCTCSASITAQDQKRLDDALHATRRRACCMESPTSQVVRPPRYGNTSQGVICSSSRALALPFSALHATLLCPAG